MKRILLPLLVSAAAFAAEAHQTHTYYNWLVQEDVKDPVRPAGVDGQPFWNKYAVQYMYPPILQFPAVKKSGDAKVTVYGAKGFETTFEESSPTVSLQRVWKKVPVGGVKVVSRGVTNEFWRAPAFRYGAYEKAPYGYAEAVKLGFDFLMKLGNPKAFLKTGKPDPNYGYNSYPSKMHSALIRAMVTYAKAVPAERETALKIARAAADYLISISQPKGAPLEYFSPTYQGENHTAKAYKGQNMLIYPAYAANAYIELYRETKEKKYLDAAVRTAETYARLQGADGTWPLKVRESDGKEVNPTRLHPFAVVTLFRNVAELTGEKAYVARAERALAFIQKGPATDWKWNGQFEDVGPTSNYSNLTKHPACDLALILLRDYPNDPKRVALARELVRWSEDQFVCWEVPYKDEKKPMWQKIWYDWTTSPGVFEQYCYRVPVDASAAKMIRAYLALYKVTGNPLDLAKARALGDALVRVQAAAPKHSIGKIQTIGFVGNTDFWLNCMFASMEALAQLAEADETIFGHARPELPWNKAWSDIHPSATNSQQLTTNNYFFCDLMTPFDVGTTAGRPSQRVVSHRGEPGFSITPVPAAMYTRAYVLCSDNGDKAKEPTFVVRLTRWADTSEWNYEGRAHEGMAETTVDLRTAKKTKVGDLWLVEVPLDLGDYQDIVRTDSHGNFLDTFGRYLDLEFLGPTIARCAPLGDRMMDPDPRRVSSVTVYGARLEYPAAEFAMRWSEPGNIFHNDEKPVTSVDVTVNRPGTYTLAWTISDADGKVITTGSRAFTSTSSSPSTSTFNLDLPPDLGWYALVWKLTDGEGRTLMTHNASFAVLGKDTRTSGFGEGPYGIGSAYSWHYRIPDAHYPDGAKLALKLGVRHYDQPKYGGYKLTLEERRKWKLGTSLFSVLHNDYSPVFRGKKTEEQLAAELRKRLQDDPNTGLCQLFWESHPSSGYAQAPELTGGVYDPAKGYAGASNRVALAKAATAFMRKYFPEIKITLGNTLACTELIAELIRGGLPEANADYMGLEVVGRDNLPERQWNSSLQSADYFRQIAHHFGYDKWKPGSGVENNYRLDKVVGEDRQAWWYVRDQVLGQCWRFPSIHVGDMVDAGNQYTESMWGGSGICKRWPYLYPKKAYVGMATTTKVLDMVTDAQAIPTGDDCVYAVRFTRRDGKTVYGFWTSRAKAELKLTLGKGACEAIDFYGRPFALKGSVFGWLPGGDKRKTLVASEALSWIVADADILEKVECVRQTTPDAVPPADFTVVEKGDDAAKWRLAEGKVTDIETGLGKGTPCRVRAKNASFAVVDDPELGKCLELDLGEPDLTLPLPAMEYMALELKEPIALAGDPGSLGMKVKGNSGWGRLYWIVEGANGVRTVSSGYREWKDEFDFNGRMTVCYGCWSFARYPLAETTSIRDYSTYSVGDLWSRATVTYPAKLVGIAFAAESRPLFLTERREKRQKIRLADIGVFDTALKR